MIRYDNNRLRKGKYTAEHRHLVRGHGGKRLTPAETLVGTTMGAGHGANRDGQFDALVNDIRQKQTMESVGKRGSAPIDMFRPMFVSYKSGATPLPATTPQLIRNALTTSVVLTDHDLRSEDDTYRITKSEFGYTALAKPRNEASTNFEINLCNTTEFPFLHARTDNMVYDPFLQQDVPIRAFIGDGSESVSLPYLLYCVTGQLGQTQCVLGRNIRGDPTNTSTGFTAALPKNRYFDALAQVGGCVYFAVLERLCRRFGNYLEGHEWWPQLRDACTDEENENISKLLELRPIDFNQLRRTIFGKLKAEKGKAMPKRDEFNARYTAATKKSSMSVVKSLEKFMLIQRTENQKNGIPENSIPINRLQKFVDELKIELWFKDILRQPLDLVAEVDGDDIRITDHRGAVVPRLSQFSDSGQKKHIRVTFIHTQKDHVDASKVPRRRYVANNAAAIMDDDLVSQEDLVQEISAKAMTKLYHDVMHVPGTIIHCGTELSDIRSIKTIDGVYHKAEATIFNRYTQDLMGVVGDHRIDANNFTPGRWNPYNALAFACYRQTGAWVQNFDGTNRWTIPKESYAMDQSRSYMNCIAAVRDDAKLSEFFLGIPTRLTKAGAVTFESAEEQLLFIRTAKGMMARIDNVRYSSLPTQEQLRARAFNEHLNLYIPTDIEGSCWTAAELLYMWNIFGIHFRITHATWGITVLDDLPLKHPPPSSGDIHDQIDGEERSEEGQARMYSVAVGTMGSVKTTTKKVVVGDPDMVAIANGKSYSVVDVKLHPKTALISYAEYFGKRWCSKHPQRRNVSNVTKWIHDVLVQQRLWQLASKMEVLRSTAPPSALSVSPMRQALVRLFPSLSSTESLHETLPLLDDVKHIIVQEPKSKVLHNRHQMSYLFSYQRIWLIDAMLAAESPHCIHGIVADAIYFRTHDSIPQKLLLPDAKWKYDKCENSEEHAPSCLGAMKSLCTAPFPRYPELKQFTSRQSFYDSAFKHLPEVDWRIWTKPRVVVLGQPGIGKTYGVISSSLDTYTLTLYSILSHQQLLNKYVEYQKREVKLLLDAGSLPRNHQPAMAMSDFVDVDAKSRNIEDFEVSASTDYLNGNFRTVTSSKLLGSSTHTSALEDLNTRGDVFMNRRTQLVVVDEFGLVDPGKLDSNLKKYEEAGIQVVLCGDSSPATMKARQLTCHGVDYTPEVGTPIINVTRDTSVGRTVDGHMIKLIDTMASQMVLHGDKPPHVYVGKALDFMATQRHISFYSSETDVNWICGTDAAKTFITELASGESSVGTLDDLDIICSTRNCYHCAKTVKGKKVPTPPEKCTCSFDDTTSADRWWTLLLKDVFPRWVCQKSFPKKGQYRGNCVIQDTSPGTNYVRSAVTSVHAKQGLTSKSILLIDMRRLFDAEKMLYTAISRAKELHNVYIFLPEENWRPGPDDCRRGMMFALPSLAHETLAKDIFRSWCRDELGTDNPRFTFPNGKSLPMELRRPIDQDHETLRRWICLNRGVGTKYEVDVAICENGIPLLGIEVEKTFPVSDQKRKALDETLLYGFIVFKIVAPDRVEVILSHKAAAMLGDVVADRSDVQEKDKSFWAEEWPYSFDIMLGSSEEPSPKRQRTENNEVSSKSSTLAWARHEGNFNVKEELCEWDSDWGEMPLELRKPPNKQASTTNKCWYDSDSDEEPDYDLPIGT